MYKSRKNRWSCNTSRRICQRGGNVQSLPEVSENLKKNVKNPKHPKHLKNPKNTCHRFLKMKTAINLVLLTAITTKAQNSHNGTLSQTEMDSMLKLSCQQDAECLTFLDELQALEQGGLTRTLSEESLERWNYLRRLKNLKLLVLHLQPEHRFLRYCHYGCYCLTDPLYTLTPPPSHGKPRDPIDAACKVQHQCYECAEMDHPSRSCTADRVQYSYVLTRDESDVNNHWKKSIECTDDPMSKKRPGQISPKWSCRRSMCECDKRLAEQLRENFDQWSDEYRMVFLKCQI